MLLGQQALRPHGPDRDHGRQEDEREQQTHQDAQPSEDAQLAHHADGCAGKGEQPRRGGEPGHQDGQAGMAHGVDQRAQLVALALVIAEEHGQQVHRVAHRHGQQERGQEGGDDGERGVRNGHQSHRRDHAEQHDDHRHHDPRDAAKQQEQKHHDHQQAEHCERAHVVLHGRVEEHLHHRSARHVQREIRAVELGHHLVHRRHQRPVLRLGEGHPRGRSVDRRRAALAVVEPFQQLVLLLGRGEGEGLDHHAGDLAVLGEEVIAVEIGAQRPLFQRRQGGIGFGKVLQEVLHHQHVALAPGVADVDQAGHLVQVRHAAFQGVVERHQLGEEGPVEDLLGSEGDDHHLVPPELVAELVVVDQGLIVLVEEGQFGGLHPHLGHLGRQRRHHQHHRRQREPAEAVNEPRQRLEAPIDLLTPIRHDRLLLFRFPRASGRSAPLVDRLGPLEHRREPLPSPDTRGLKLESPAPPSAADSRSPPVSWPADPWPALLARMRHRALRSF